MEQTTLFYVASGGFILLTLCCVIVILVGLQKILLKTSFSIQKQKQISLLTSFSLVVWLVLIAVLSLTGITSLGDDIPQFPPRLLLFVNFALLTCLLLTIFSKNLKEILRHVPAQWLIYAQSFRIAVELLLWFLFVQNLLPIQMTFEGYNFDVLIGLVAPFVGYWVSKIQESKLQKRVILIWNLIGIGLVTTIVVISILSMPIPFRQFMNAPSARIMTTFPFSWLPSFLVVLAYALHFFSIKKVFLR